MMTADISAEYVKKNGRLFLFRLFQDGPCVLLPDRIAGEPVYALADHSFALSPSVLYSETEIRRTEPFDGRTGPLCGEKLESVTFPEGLAEIGNYAFYGCGSLRDISFPSSIRRIGSGLFSGCTHIRRFVFRVPAPGQSLPNKAGDGQKAVPITGLSSGPSSLPLPEAVRLPVTPPVLQELLKTVTHEVEVIVKDMEDHVLYRLLYPEYYEEPKENTPARIIEIIWHGTGYQYRNTFLSRQIQFFRYDELFPAALAQESPQTLVKMALYRLLYPQDLLPQHRKQYAEYLQGHPEDLWSEIWSEIGQDPDFPGPAGTLRLLDREGFFSEQATDILIGCASRSHAADAAAYLMDLKHRRFQKKQRTADRFRL